MRPPRIFWVVSTNTVARGCALILALASSYVAGAEGEGLDEEALRADARETFKKKVGPFVKTYCTKCHGGGRAKANISFEVALKAPGRGAAFQHWKKAVANVKVHDMPPKEDVRKIPTEEERRQFAEWIDKLKYLAPRDPGPFVIRRLTPVEYGNTLRDLYGVDPSIADKLPEEVVGEGYLNSISPLQSELFLELANKARISSTPPLPYHVDQELPNIPTISGVSLTKR